MWKSGLLITLSAVAVANAEQGTWARTLGLVESARARRDDIVSEESNLGNSSNNSFGDRWQLGIPLPEYAENERFFSVDYCSRYHCKCYKMFSTSVDLLEHNNVSWSASDKGSARAGCFMMDAAKKLEVCMWDNRVCDCAQKDFFVQNDEGVSGVDYLYPRTPFTNATSGSAAALNFMRATRSSSTENQCIYCQNGFYLSGGQCYTEGSVSPAFVMAGFILLTTIPAFMGMWYVLHGIEDPGVSDIPDYDEKKNY